MVRGKARYGDGMLLADNDGVLAWEEGWLITDKYDGSMQRYRIDNSCNGYMGAHLGQFAIDGKSYYGREDTGYVVRGLYRNPSGQYYYGNNDGVLQPLPSNYAMLYKAQSYSSGTKYLILVDRSAHKVGVFQGAHNNWNQLYNWSCVVGAPGTPTITGVYHTTGGKRTSLSTDSRAIWCTQIWGGYFFHSILASESELGQSLSHGCIRLPYSAARWIYDNINFGTTVVIYN